MPPESPPAPIVTAGIPSEIATLESVEEATSSGSAPTIRVASMAAAISGSPVGMTPEGRSPITTISSSSGSVPGRRRSFSPATACSIAARAASSSATSSLAPSLRMSISHHASAGIALMVVPPPMRATVRLEGGSVESGIAASAAVAVPSACSGLARPKSDHECPPGPRTSTRTRREPSARCTIRRNPDPSMETNAPAPESSPPARKRCFTPNRSPAPSSPVVATNQSGRTVGSRSSAIAAAVASSAVRPRQLSVIPGAWIRRPTVRGSTSVPAGNTVSRWAVTTAGCGCSPPEPGSSPSTFPTSSACTRCSPTSLNRSATYAPRFPSWKVGAGMATMRRCSSSAVGAISRMRARAARIAGCAWSVPGSIRFTGP